MHDSELESLPPFFQFINDFERHIEHSSDRIITTLSNVFTMRLVGNKTHGDLAEIAIAEYINQFLETYDAKHVGKDLYRAKSSEEDIELTRKFDGIKIPVSLKAYGDGPLQLSTDKKTEMYPLLQSFNKEIIVEEEIQEVFQSSAFQAFQKINVLPLIYDEKKSKCNIMVFDYLAAIKNTAKIVLESAGSGRKHPCFRFYDVSNNYICEVRYGDAAANALQRGMWTNTKKAHTYFRSVTKGWISYSHNLDLVRLLSLALASNEEPIKEALELLARKIND
jgi:hypothetical protein